MCILSMIFILVQNFSDVLNLLAFPQCAKIKDESSRRGCLSKCSRRMLQCEEEEEGMDGVGDETKICKIERH